MKFIRKMFGDGQASPRSSFPSSVAAESSVEQTKSRNAPRRELVRVTLRETMRRHGIPADWMDCRTFSVLTRQHKPGMHVQFLVRKADHQILPWVHAFQESFWEQILRTDAHARDWLFSVGWEFYGHSEQGFDRMPGAGKWRSEPDTQAMEGDTMPPEMAHGDSHGDSKEDIASDLQMLQALITQPAELTDIPDTPRPAKR